MDERVREEYESAQSALQRLQRQYEELSRLYAVARLELARRTDSAAQLKAAFSARDQAQAEVESLRAQLAQVQPADQCMNEDE